MKRVMKRTRKARSFVIFVQKGALKQCRGRYMIFSRVLQGTISEESRRRVSTGSGNKPLLRAYALPIYVFAACTLKGVRPLRMQRLFVWAWFLVLLAVAGCGQEPAYTVSRLAFERQGWDTLSVDVAFSRSSRWGASQSLEPEEVAVYLFNAAYDTLYAGDVTTFLKTSTEVGS